MSIVIRDVREHELDSVLALNNAAGPTILPLDASRARFFYEHATYFRVAEVDGHLAGFLIAFDQDSVYQSSNYLWFRERFPAFVYIDRVVVASSRRGAGLGRVFYADVQSFAEVRAPLLACEVFLEPRNDVAVLFHGTYGFQEVGQHVMPETGLRVSLLTKDMCSYPWVRETYLQNPEHPLPELPWLTARPVAASPTQLATGT
jgi:predicted GNAT superfamily acetyltransferase